MNLSEQNSPEFPSHRLLLSNAKPKDFHRLKEPKDGKGHTDTEKQNRDDTYFQYQEWEYGNTTDSSTLKW